MPFSRFALPTVPSRLLLVIALMLAAALWLWLIGHWGVYFSSPPAAARPALTLPTPPAAAQAIVARHLFGQADRQTAADGAVLIDSGVVRVLGVASSDGSGKGFAVVSVDGKPSVAAVEGQEFAPGLRLVRVTSQGIEFERGGVLQQAVLAVKSSGKTAISLPERAPGNLPRQPPAVNMSAPSAPAS